MGLQGLEFLTMAKPEFIMRGTADGTFDTMRTAEDFKNQVDNVRLKMEVSCDTAGRQSLLDTMTAMLEGNMEGQQAITSAKMFKAFRFKAKSNSKEHSGSINENFQQMLESMGCIHRAEVVDAHTAMAQLNNEKFKNWEAVLQYMRDNKDHPNLGDPRYYLEQYPFVRDFIDAFRNHAVCDYNASVFFNDCQLSMAAKNKGIAATFNDAWEA